MALRRQISAMNKLSWSPSCISLPRRRWSRPLWRRGLRVCFCRTPRSYLAHPRSIPSSPILHSCYAQAQPRPAANRPDGFYAIAGWVGSTLGIGMGQYLGRVPLAFVAVAGVVLLEPACVSLVKARPREITLVLAALAATFLVYRAFPTMGRAQSIADQFRQYGPTEMFLPTN